MALDLSREPVSLAEAKKHLGVRTDFRDDEISSLVVAARERVEAYTGRALVRRDLVQALAGSASGRDQSPEPIYFELGPVHAVKAVRYLSASEGMVEFVTPFQAIGPIGNRWLLHMVDGPGPSLRSSAFTQIEYVAGFGPLEPGGVGAEVPVPRMLVQAMLLLVGSWFENHEASVVGTSAVELPFGVKDLCRDFRPSGVV